AQHKTKRPGRFRPRPLSEKSSESLRESLLEMIRNELRHLEHRNLALAAEYGAELVVGVDESLVDGILKPVLLDVVPDLLRHFSAGKRLRADDRAERR